MRADTLLSKNRSDSEGIDPSMTPTFAATNLCATNKPSLRRTVMVVSQLDQETFLREDISEKLTYAKSTVCANLNLLAENRLLVGVQRPGKATVWRKDLDFWQSNKDS